MAQIEQIDDIPPPPIPVLNPEYIRYVSNRPPGVINVLRDRFRKWMEWPTEAPYGTTAQGLPIHGPVEWRQYYPTIGSIGRSIIKKTTHEKRDFLANRGFEFIRELGSGAFGEVWLVHVLNADNPQQFACKVLQMSRFNPSKTPESYVKTLKKETELQRSLNHTNIVRIENVIHMNDEERDVNYIVSYLFMELCDTDLNRFISRSTGGYLTEDLANNWFQQIAGAVKYIHDRNISHLDIKPSNIMVKLEQTDGHVFKLSDFGIAKAFDINQPNIGTDMRGTPIYMPPEVYTIPNLLLRNIVPLKYDTKAFDIYSLGISLLHSLSGMTALLGQFFLGHINECCYIAPKDIFLRSGISEPLIDLIHRMTDLDPKKRLTIDQVIQHPWLQ